jgi:hypothetical protein
MLVPNPKNSPSLSKDIFTERLDYVFLIGPMNTLFGGI